MLNEFLLPNFAPPVNQAIITQWLIKEDAEVKAGKPLLEVTVDKATLWVDSPFTGTLVKQIAKPGDLAACNSILALIGSPREAIPDYIEKIKFVKATADSCLRFRSSLDEPPASTPSQKPNAMRTVIANRMTASATRVPHFYITSQVDMSACMELRTRLKKEEKLRIPYHDMIIMACVLALKKHPEVIALYHQNKYFLRNNINIGFAVSLDPDSLYVPVIKDADKLNLVEISRQTKKLIQKVREHKLSPDEFSGGVFTVSNMGGFDVESFTAIINPGESAILAIGKIQDSPVAVKHQVEILPMMNITLSSDHRAIDGVQAARFIAMVKNILQTANNSLIS